MSMNNDIIEEQHYSKYIVHCILPWDRKICFQSLFESNLIREIADVRPHDVRENVILVQLKDYQTTNFMSLHDLGMKFSFTYCAQLAFLHEKEYRHLIFSTTSVENDEEASMNTISPIERETIGNFLNAGHLVNGLSIKYVGSVDSSFVGYGLFAETFIPCGVYIGEYTGIVRQSSVHSSDDDSYTFLYPSSEVSYEICAREFGNVIRFINHNSTSANVQFRRVHHEGLMHIVCFAISDIEPHQQLLVDYGAAYWTNKPYGPVKL
eukprot:gene26154-34199_t